MNQKEHASSVMSVSRAKAKAFLHSKHLPIIKLPISSFLQSETLHDNYTLYPFELQLTAVTHSPISEYLHAELLKWRPCAAWEKQGKRPVTDPVGELKITQTVALSVRQWSGATAQSTPLPSPDSQPLCECMCINQRTAVPKTRRVAYTQHLNGTYFYQFY